MVKKKLTNKQKQFVNEYLVDLNGTQAAIRAGYSKSTAGVIASENLKKPYIQEAIAKAVENRARRTLITQDRVLKELARLAFFDVRQLYDESGNLIPVHQLPEEVAAAIGGLDVVTETTKDLIKTATTKIKLIDKKGSLELIGRHLKMFVDRQLHEGEVNFNTKNMDPRLTEMIQAVEESIREDVEQSSKEK